MNNKIKSSVLIISSMLLASSPSYAASLINGDFQTGDFSGWSQGIDGAGAPAAGLNDFTIIQPIPGNHAARIEADYWSTPGDTTSTAQDEAFFASTLYQGLDLTTSTGQNLQLSFDWTFAGEQTRFDENLIVGLGDGSGNYFNEKGNLGFLFNPTNYGSGTYTTTLDAVFFNAIGWTLEFQMNAGVDGYGSHFIIDNVNLEAISVSPPVSAVPVPAAFWLMLSGLAGVLSLKRKKSNI